jgi:hypothetical protein
MKRYIMRFDETMDATFGLHAISLVNEGAMKSLYVSLSAEQVVKLSAEKKGIVTGALMIPDIDITRQGKNGEADYQIQFPTETIELAAQDFMKNGRNSNITIEHSLGVEDVYLTEMWIKEDEVHDKSVSLGIDAPIGSLMVSLKIDNKEVREELIDTGLLKAFSLEGKFAPELVQLSTQKSKDMSCNTEIKGDSIIEKIKKLVNGMSAETVELKVEEEAAVEETVELAEDKIAEVSKWWEDVESFDVKVGEKVMRKPFEEGGSSNPVRDGEYETEGGEKFLVDKEGIIRFIFETVDEKEEEVATEAAAEADGETKVEAEADVAEEVEASAEEAPEKVETIAEVKEKIEEKVVEQVEMVAHTDTTKTHVRNKRQKFDKSMTVQERIQANLSNNFAE